VEFLLFSSVEDELEDEDEDDELELFVEVELEDDELRLFWYSFCSSLRFEHSEFSLLPFSNLQIFN